MAGLPFPEIDNDYNITRATVASANEEIVMVDRIIEFSERYLGAEAPMRGPALLVLTLLTLWAGYKFSRRAIRRYMISQNAKPQNMQNFLLFYRYIWMGAGFVLAVISLSGSLTSLGISAAFVGMIFGWSLQAPVTGIAAWLMIILKRPFGIGDRVIISGIIGDVTDINLTHVVLNQVGGTVGGEEKSGRGVLIPNATLFSQVIYNYTLDAKYILDEVLVRLTFDSDFEMAEQICLQAARAVTPEIIKDSGFEPNIRCELFESGVLIRLRYQTQPSDRQRLSSDITRKILADFKANYDRIKFCYPHSVVRYQPDADSDGQALPQPLSRTDSPADSEEAR